MLRLGNRLAGQCVLIQRRTGWFRRIAVTPDDADGFIGQVTAIRGRRAYRQRAEIGEFACVVYS